MADYYSIFNSSQTRALWIFFFFFFKLGTRLWGLLKGLYMLHLLFLMHTNFKAHRVFVIFVIQIIIHENEYDSHSFNMVNLVKLNEVGMLGQALLYSEASDGSVKIFLVWNSQCAKSSISVFHVCQSKCVLFSGPSFQHAGRNYHESWIFRTTLLVTPSEYLRDWRLAEGFAVFTQVSGSAVCPERVQIISKCRSSLFLLCLFKFSLFVV